MLQIFTYSTGLALTGRSAACAPPTITKTAAQPSRMFFDIGHPRPVLGRSLVRRLRVHNRKRPYFQSRPAFLSEGVADLPTPKVRGHRQRNTSSRPRPERCTEGQSPRSRVFGLWIVKSRSFRRSAWTGRRACPHFLLLSHTRDGERSAERRAVHACEARRSPATPAPGPLA